MIDGEVDIQYMLVNSGNLSENLTLSTDPAGLRVNPATLTLAPGERATVTVSGTLPRSKATTRRITLKVQGQGGLTRTEQTTSAALISELPVAERALTLRGQVRFSVGPALHTELALSGRIHPKVPGTVDLYASDTTWRARYTTKTYTVAAGHLSHPGLSQQAGTSLFGVSGTVMEGPWHADVSAGSHEGAFAGGITVRYVGAQAGASLGVVTSRLGTTVAADATGRSGPVRAWAGAAMDLTTTAARGTIGVTYQSQTNTATVSGSYRAAGYQGQTNADVTVNAEMRHQFRKDLSGTVSGVYQRDPMTPGASAMVSVTGRLNAPKESVEVSVKGIGSQVTDAQVRYQKAAWDTRLKWSSGTAVMQTSTVIPAGPITLRPTVGAQLNLQAKTVRPVVGLGADFGIRSGAVNLGILSPTSSGAPWTVTGSLNTKIQQADLSVSGSVTVGNGQSRPQWRAVLSYPLELITGRRPDVGRLEGRLLRPDGQPITGLRLQAGELTTITDATGRFVFPDVPQGTVQLNVVEGDAVAGLRARPALPLPVTIVGGQTSTVTIRLSPGVTVQGQVVLDWPAAGEVAGKLVVPDAPALASLVVRLSGPEGSYEARLAGDGTFKLNSVQPGTYDLLLSVDGSALLTTARLVTATLTVPEDGWVMADLHLLPITQEVQVEEGGSLELK
ncbi:hypothetical protein LAJ19_10805 [Deinococcus taeanensis]|uniref:carboxypeptidase regulatory-like domain-containing protein n=1 Tax=Deinococcus taeanensis TaxID=2737050 RepID=UPI001CDBEF27|nr:carboxypeptidase regulatory-like domain-containing protein [Deinococcus taeanensis]UBV42118.1 hypothetical protein LAJ19_10805 [Deinococcus taeanensis]